MKNNCASFLFVLLLWPFLTSCESSLAVFINPVQSPVTFGGLKDVTINLDGHFELTWEEASTLSKSPIEYEIYLAKTSDPSLVPDSISLTEDTLLATAEVVDPSVPKPQDIGSLLATVKGTGRFVLTNEVIDPEMLYSFQVKLKSTHASSRLQQKVVATKINFRGVESTDLSVARDNINLTWAPVLGATSYQIFADSRSTEALYTTPTPSIALSFLQAAQKDDFCVRAVRGLMRSKHCFAIKGIGESWNPVITSITPITPPGLYSAGTVLKIQVRFSDNMYRVPGSNLSLPILLDGKEKRSASYSQGDGTDVFTFTYTIAQGDNAEHIFADAALQSSTPKAVVDAEDRAASLDLTLLDKSMGDTLAIDTQTPELPSSIGFPTVMSNASSTLVAWSGGTDAHLSHYNAMICESSDCLDSCSSIVSTTNRSTYFPTQDGSTYFACVQAVDKVGLKSAWASSLQSLKIDQTAPTILRVTSPAPNGFYKTGDVLPIRIDFSEPVVVNESIDVGLLLKVGSGTRIVPYSSGSGTSSLTFNYTVLSGDAIADLDYNSTGSFVIGGSATVKDAAKNVANLVLPVPGAANSLAANKNLTIDSILPSSPSSVGFGSSTSTSTNLSLAWGTSIDTNFKTHHIKICADNGCSVSCSSEITSVSSPVTLVGSNGSSYYGCVQGEDEAGQFSSWISSITPIRIDSIAPTVVKVSSSHPDGVFKVGESIPVTVQLSEDVVVTNPSSLRLNLGLAGRFATYVSGSSSSSITFNYTVQSGDNAAAFDYANANALILNGATIKDEAGNDANLSLAAPGSTGSISATSQIIIDTIAPTAPSSVSVSSSSTSPTVYGISWTNSADSNLKYHNMKLCTASDCSSGCLGPSTANQSPASLIAAANQTYFGCVQGEDLAGHVSSWAVSSGSVQMDNTPPTVLNVSSSKANGAYATGILIPIQVTFSEVVFVSNPSLITLSLETGAADEVLTYSGGDGTDTLSFIYTVRSGNNSSRLDYLSDSALALGSGAHIQDASGNEAVLTLPAPSTPTTLAGMSNIIIDTTSPTAPTSPGFGSASSVTSSLAFGWSDSTDSYFKQHNVKLCPASDCSSSCLATFSTLASPYTFLAVPDGTYYGCVQGEDTASQKSSWISSLSSITVDATAPTVVRVTSPNMSGFYKAGTSLTFTVEFSEPVVLTNTGDLSLLLETGSVDRSASFLSLAGNTMSFGLTVAAGDTTSLLNTKDASSLSLGTAATVRDAAGNNATLTLPMSGSNSLGGSKSIVLDTTAPTPGFVTPVASSTGPGSIAVVVSCETGNTVSLTGALTSPVLNALCVSNTVTRTLYFSSGEGVKTVVATESDKAGNTGTASRSFVNDNVAPLLTQTAVASTIYSSSNSLTIGGACEDGLPVIVSLNGIEEGRHICSGQVWTFATASQTTDAARTYVATQSDAAGNNATVSVTWIRDTRPPNFTFDDLSTTYTITVNANSYTFRGSCDSSASVSNPSIRVSGPGISGTASVNCTLGSWSYLSPINNSNGFYLYTFVQTDIAGNTATIYGSWTRNASGPALTTLSTLIKSRSNQATFAGACDSSYTISVSGPGSPTPPSCTAGSWSFTTPVISSDGNHVYTLTQTSNLGDSTNIAVTYRRDTGLPTVSSMSVNNGDTETLAYRINVSFSASDSSTTVSSICLFSKIWSNASTPPAVPATPSASDTCWQSLLSLGVSPAQNISLSDLPFTLDLASAKYSVYAFVKDEVGNISSVADTEGVGRATISLALPSPPSLSILDVTDTFGNAQSDFSAGDELEIHWKISGGSGIGSSPVTIRWSSDDSSWSTIAADIADGANNCSVIAGASGCLTLTAPEAGYFRLQLAVKNVAGNQFFLESRPLNTWGKVRVVAGRTFKGLGGTARGFQLNYLNIDQIRASSPNQFVVTRQGVIYAIDSSLGIIKVDPKDQVVRVAYPMTTYPGDGNMGSNMGFATPNKIWLDKKQPLQRLFVSDNGTLKILDFNTNQSITINGTTTAGTDGLTKTIAEVYPSNQAVYVKLQAMSGGIWYHRLGLINEATKKYDFFTVDPNGLPYYNTTSNTICDNFAYRITPMFGADGSLTKLVQYAPFISTHAQYNCRGYHVWNFQHPGSMLGTYAGEAGNSGMPAPMHSTWDTQSDTTSFVGLNGKAYGLYRNGIPNSGLIEYDANNNVWNKVVALPGTTFAQRVSCSDGTLATNCDVDMNDAFVDENSTIYFMDQGQIRLVDTNKKIQTIFGTSYRNLSNNLSASDTVLGPFVHYLQRRVTANGDEEIVYSHHASATYRQVIDGKINILAGDGSTWAGAASGPASGPAPGIREGWTLAANYPFGMDDDGNLYAGDYGLSSASQQSTIFKLSRNTSTWSTFVPYTCSGCTGIAANTFDSTASGSYSPSTPVQLYSARLGVPSPVTMGSTRSVTKPPVLGFQDGKIFFHSQDAPFIYNGSSAPYITDASYLLNSQISAADVATFNGTTLTGTTRLLGTKGTALLTGKVVTPADSKYATGYLSAFPSEGVAANAFDVQVPYWNGGLYHVIRSFQQYDGAYYTAFLTYGNKKVLKITPAAVTTRVTTANPIMTFKLIKSGSDDILYYCSTTGKLLKMNLTSPTSPAETEIPLLIPGATCSGSTLLHYVRDSKDYLMFVYTQNSLNGIVELKIMP